MTDYPLSDLPILILAAGQSRRMRGRDKLMEVVDGTPLIARQAARARAATTGAVLAALPPAPHARRAALAGLDIEMVDVPDAAMGMSASLRRGLESLPKDTQAAMVLLADLPELTTSDMISVLRAVDLSGKARIWRATTSDGAPGHPIVFASDLFAPLMSLSGDTGGAEIIMANRDITKLVPLPANHARRDLDTPEDWADWRAGRCKRDH